MLSELLGKQLYSAVTKYCPPDKLYEVRIKLSKNIRISGSTGRMDIPDTVTTEQLLNEIVRIATANSLYAYNDYLIHGYLPYSGGIRIGVCGEAVVENNAVKTFKYITSLIIRVPHEIVGCADKIMQTVGTENPQNTIVMSPPACGKTTLLRDIARQLSIFHNVLVIDEKNELGATYKGINMLNVGRSDVIVGLPRGIGLQSAIRNMSPDVIITDEIYSDHDLAEIELAIKSGVKVITSIHTSGQAITEKLGRQLSVFDVQIELGNNPVGSIESIKSRSQMCLK